MKRLIMPAILGLSTLVSLGCQNPANAVKSSNQNSEQITQLTTVDTENIPQSQTVNLNSETKELAYRYCYWETYSDGSTYWVCW